LPRQLVAGPNIAAGQQMIAVDYSNTTIKHLANIHIIPYAVDFFLLGPATSVGYSACAAEWKNT